MTTSRTARFEPDQDAERRLRTVTGAGAVLGGVAWVTAAVLHAFQPSGCVGNADCATVPMREATLATSVLVGLAGVLLAVSGAALLLLIRRRGRLGRAAVVGAALAGLGGSLLAIGVTVQAVFFGRNFAAMPAFVVPGVGLLAAGLVLVGVAVLRSRVLPRWAGVSIMVGAVLFLAANEQTAAVLLAVPFGLAWIATGVSVLLTTPRVPDRPGSSPAR